MLRRKAERAIAEWLGRPGKALLVTGARQVGKTYIVRETLRERGIPCAEFNLIRDREVLEILRGHTSVDDLLMKLSLFSPTRLEPHRTVIFFDEIQEYPEIVTAVKFLVEDGRFRYVLSGSMLGVELRNLRSAPVGYVETLTMYPLDFEEFLQLFGVTDGIWEMLRRCYRERLPVDDAVHRKLTDIFSLYLIIGGMPAAVEAYRRTNSIDDVIVEHGSIIRQYRQDFTKYEEESRRLRLTRIYDIIPAELNEKNKRFLVSDVERGARLDRTEDSFLWLTAAGVAIAAYNVTEPALPLTLNRKMSLFKLFLSDVGMLTTMYGRSVKLDIVSGKPGINRGAVYENAVAQELVAHGYDLSYYASKRLGELDFVIEHAGKALPIEVKSGKDYARHSALDNVLAVPGYGIGEAFVFSPGNVSAEGKIVNYPAYMVMFLQEESGESGVLPLSGFAFKDA